MSDAVAHIPQIIGAWSFSQKLFQIQLSLKTIYLKEIEGEPLSAPSYFTIIKCY